MHPGLEVKFIAADATNTSRENAKVSKCNLKQLLGMTSIFVFSFVMK